jgi:hypothetical protein
VLRTACKDVVSVTSCVCKDVVSAKTCVYELNEGARRNELQVMCVSFRDALMPTQPKMPLYAPIDAKSVPEKCRLHVRSCTAISQYVQQKTRPISDPTTQPRLKKIKP